MPRIERNDVVDEMTMSPLCIVFSLIRVRRSSAES
jgi:hypothetical protein